MTPPGEASRALVPSTKPRLFERMREVLRGMDYSYRTEKTYRYWVRYFILWSGKRNPRDMGGSQVFSRCGGERWSARTCSSRRVRFRS